MIYKPDHFELVELVSKDIYESFGERAWQFLDVYTLISLDNIRKYFDSPVYVNNWDSGGSLQFRGFRSRFTDVGADYSQHRFGRAFDLDVKNFTSDEIRKEIKSNKDLANFEYITCLEEKVSWVHFDTRPLYEKERILLVYP